MANIAAVWPRRRHACIMVGLTGDRPVWGTTRRCRAPHHTLSDAGLIGGAPWWRTAMCRLPSTSSSAPTRYWRAHATGSKGNCQRSRFA
jgi:hypothetical protein